MSKNLCTRISHSLSQLRLYFFISWIYLCFLQPIYSCNYNNSVHPPHLTHAHAIPPWSDCVCSGYAATAPVLILIDGDAEVVTIP